MKSASSGRSCLAISLQIRVLEKELSEPSTLQTASSALRSLRIVLFETILSLTGIARISRYRRSVIVLELAEPPCSESCARMASVQNVEVVIRVTSMTWSKSCYDLPNSNCKGNDDACSHFARIGIIVKNWIKQFMFCHILLLKTI